MDSEQILIRPIAHIHTDLPGKFGVPRQSGLVPSLLGRVVFTPEYRSADAVRGLEAFSHIWLIWRFSAAAREGAPFSPTVRPPRLGGNVRVGVFASRSPFRPNSLGLSSVALENIEYTPDRGPVLVVRGADLMDGTPIVDVKPYLPYADSHPEARGGYADTAAPRSLRCQIPPELLEKIPPDKREALRGVLEQDPRPSYQEDPRRVYGFTFAGLEVKFQVRDGVAVVVDVE